MSRHRPLHPSVACLALVAALAAPAPAQARAPEVAVGPDPYTRGDRALLDAAGYESLGPFALGLHHDSAATQALLRDESLHWIETAHFRIGASLSPLAIDRRSDEEWTRLLGGELDRLRQRLPGVPAKVVRLDPWLRAHLIAQRAEETWREVAGLLGVDDASFAATPGDPQTPQSFMGVGPNFGMKEKFTILLVQRAASLERYTAAHHGWGTSRPSRSFDHGFGNAFFGAAEEPSHGLLRDDLVLRAHLTFHVAWMLYTSYRSYGHNLPAWLPVGLAWHHARAVTTSVPVYDLEPGDAGRQRYLLWQKRVPQLLRARGFEPLSTLVARMDVDAFTMDQHLQCWALVDHLLAHRRAQFVAFFDRMKEPFHGRLRFPTDDELLARQRQAFASAFGVDVDGLEASWRRVPSAAARSRN